MAEPVEGDTMISETTGKHVLGDLGNQYIHDPTEDVCCREFSLYPCVNCKYQNETPTAFRVTVSGVTLCSACTSEPGGPSGFATIVAGALNGIFVAEQEIALPCYYHSDIIAQVRWDKWTGANCANGTHTWIVYDVYAAVQIITSGGGTYAVQGWLAAGFTGQSAWQGQKINCAAINGLTLPNEYTQCFYDSIAINGTMSITAL